MVVRRAYKSASMQASGMSRYFYVLSYTVDRHASGDSNLLLLKGVLNIMAGREVPNNSISCYLVITPIFSQVSYLPIAGSIFYSHLDSN